MAKKTTKTKKTEPTFTSADVVAWLQGLGQYIVRTSPVTVIIGDKKPQTYVGARYVQEHEYTASMMAVTHGEKQAGDKYRQESIYLVGKLPKVYARRPNGTCFVVDSRFDDDIWYVAGYYQLDQVNPHHPFGNMFMLGQWPSTHGPIDDPRRRPYDRVPMEIRDEVDAAD